MEKGWNQYLNKIIRIYFDDYSKVAWKEGILKSFDNDCLFLQQTIAGSDMIAIPINRIIRVEIKVLLND